MELISQMEPFTIWKHHSPSQPDLPSKANLFNKPITYWEENNPGYLLGVFWEQIVFSSD